MVDKIGSLKLTGRNQVMEGSSTEACLRHAVLRKSFRSDICKDRTQQGCTEVYKVRCEICNKKFKSRSTFEAHCLSPRHLWKLEQRSMTSSIEVTTDAEMDGGGGKSKLLDEMKVLRNEGLASQESDPKQSALLLAKAGKGYFRINELEMARDCLQKALDLANECLKHRLDDDNSDDLYQDDVFENEDGNNNVMNDSDKNRMDSEIDDVEFRGRTQTKTRLKRLKMEQMNKMYSNYKLQRGTVDLYETMIQCYAESFDISPADDDRTEDGKRSTLKTSEILMNRDLVLKELADTENTYVDSLEFLVEKIIPVFAMCEEDRIREITPAIFGNIDAIYEWHRGVFLEKIEDCLEDHELLGPTFKEHEAELTDLYELYCQNKPHSDDVLVQFAEEIDQVYHNINTNYTILDYLIKPVQRIMKYQLLLQSIIKFTRKMGESTESMQDALEVMEIVPKKVNDKMHLAMIVGYTKNLDRGELVLQDTLGVAFGGGKAKPRQYRLFLFREFLLITETVARVGRLPQYRFILELKTCRLGVTHSVENDPMRFAIWTRKFKTTDIYVCMAETSEMKETWLKALGEVVSLHGSGVSTDSVKKELTPSIYKNSVREPNLSAEQIVRKATIGHPREYSMSTRLKSNIAKFLMEELTMNGQDSGLEEMGNSSSDGEFGFEKPGIKSNGTLKEFGLERSESSSDDDDKCQCQSMSQGSLSAIEEENSIKTKKGFRLWKSMKERNGTYSKSSISVKQKRLWRKDKGGTERSNSLPAVMTDENIEELTIPEANDNLISLTREEVFDFRSVAAEAQLLLVQVESSLTWEKVDELLENSLSLFYDVKSLKDIAEDCTVREVLLKKCEALYQSLKRRKYFNDQERGTVDSFYSYDGHFRLLTTYANLVAGNTTSSWPIFLATLAAVSAKSERRWTDTYTANRQLSDIYRKAQKFDYSVSCLVDEFSIQLDKNDVTAATCLLKDAFETALLSGDKEKCRSLDKLAGKLLEEKKENSLNEDSSSLRLVIEMSKAYQSLDYDWFYQNYQRICECHNDLHTEERHDLREIFMHLLEHLKESKRKKSGEIFV
ncbi:uncharacterized protein LOC135681510 isoform X2 [Rhopilema esculentum]|uniref:uncharacterized protein LOC135681510 isoform X2 n=1 Tax=Rhopilema esculentum TaxID=499914 RepID=UPI0031D9D2BB